MTRKPTEGSGSVIFHRYCAAQAEAIALAIRMADPGRWNGVPEPPYREMAAHLDEIVLILTEIVDAHAPKQRETP